MKSLNTGFFFGNHFHKLQYDDIVITDTDYTHDYVDWHYHENPYFTFLLQGELIEKNKNESHHLGAGDLLLHNWDDAHCNIRPPKKTRGFHLEIRREWFTKYNIQFSEFNGSQRILNPKIKSMMHLMNYQSRFFDDTSKITMDMLLIEIIDSMFEKQKKTNKDKPFWLNMLIEMLNETDSHIYSLSELSHVLNIHPVYLSRQFHEYFKITYSDYLKYIRMNKAISLMQSSNMTLTEIAHALDFYDQSHFNYTFKKIYNDIRPNNFRKMTC